MFSLFKFASVWMSLFKVRPTVWGKCPGRSIWGVLPIPFGHPGAWQLAISREERMQGGCTACVCMEYILLRSTLGSGVNPCTIVKSTLFHFFLTSLCTLIDSYIMKFLLMVGSTCWLILNVYSQTLSLAYICLFIYFCRNVRIANLKLWLAFTLLV